MTNTTDQHTREFQDCTTTNQGTNMATNELRPVIICTEYRGVFYGLAGDTSGKSVMLKGGRMAIAFGTTRGVVELAETGPTTNSKISARADMDVRKVTAVFEVTPAAAEKWEAA